MGDKRIEDTDGLTAEERAEIIRRLSDKDVETYPLKEVLSDEEYKEFLRIIADKNDGWE